MVFADLILTSGEFKEAEERYIREQEEKEEIVSVKPSYKTFNINKEDVKKINMAMEDIKKKWDDVVRDAMKEREDKEPAYIQEIYRDEYKTLEQTIMFKVDDYREASYLRSTINPNLKLVDTRYLNKNFKIIEEE